MKHIILAGCLSLLAGQALAQQFDAEGYPLGQAPATGIAVPVAPRPDPNINADGIDLRIQQKVSASQDAGTAVKFFDAEGREIAAPISSPVYRYIPKPEAPDPIYSYRETRTLPVDFSNGIKETYVRKPLDKPMDNSNGLPESYRRPAGAPTPAAEPIPFIADRPFVVPEADRGLSDAQLNQKYPERLKGGKVNVNSPRVATESDIEIMKRNPLSQRPVDPNWKPTHSNGPRH